MRRVLGYLGLVALVVAALNFLWLFGESINGGGDALNGFVRDGHYYISSHGVTTEVSKATWDWSRFHSLSIFVTHPLGFVGGATFMLLIAFPAMAGGTSNAGSRARRAGWVVAGRPLMATGRCRGSTGRVRLGGALPGLSVRVTRRGIAVSLPFADARAILASEIRSVSWHQVLLTPHLTISHDSPDLDSPLILFVGPDHSLTRATETLRTLPPSTEIAPPSIAARGPRIDWPQVTAVVGLVVAGGLAGIGVVWAIPNFGLFGLVWTAWAVGIGLWNARALLR